MIHFNNWKFHPSVRSDGDLTVGERIADGTVSGLGSWAFLIAQTIVVTIWVILNLFAWVEHFDPYPFILLNLAFSTQAAYSAPLILMASKRADQRNSERAQHDLDVDMEVQQIVRDIAAHLGIDSDIIKKEIK